MNVVGPTLAVLASWLVVGAVLAGCGALVARGVSALVPLAGPRRLAACVWLGYAAVVAYLQLWNLLAPISWLAWVAPLLAALAGGLAARPHLPAWRPARPGRRAAIAAPLALAAAWFANQTLGQPTDYDLGLYHLDIIRYAEKYATIPGLGNLHLRLGASDAHLLFAAFLDHGPWAGVGYRLGDGLLAVLLLFEVGSRLFAPAGGAPSFTRRVAVLLVPATVVLAGMAASVRIASANLDLAAFVLVSVGMLYLADCVENGVRPLEACAAVATLCVASATRPLYWLPAAVALVIVALQLRRAGHGAGIAQRRTLAAVCVFPALLFVGWTVREALLSGYPFFPLTFGGLPVSWRVPAAAVTAENRLDDAWARWPDMPANVVFSSWRWLWEEWFKWEKIDLAVTAPLMLLAGLAPALTGRDAGRRARLRPMLALVLPLLPVLAIWFQEAPDPRFVWAPIWLVAIALVAWALPPVGSPYALALVGASGGVVLTLVFVHHFVWLLPATLAVWGYLWLLSLLLRRRRWPGFVAHAAVVSAVVAMLGVLVDRDAYAVVQADQSGPFGTPLLAATPVRAARSPGGLQYFKPVETDQCFAVLLCTPQISSDRIHLRGHGLASGFSVDP